MIKGHHIVMLLLVAGLGYMAWKHKKATGKYI